ncbi:cGMP-dependent protein kinase egl-4 (Egg-laying defective protein 4) [Durusdinium trenchii]|uniref:cGMP-dependent protein kinase n=1 Tax=Durusdinium trenchii TaxID=1381693 RepID=A0ABP0QK06_9DINO
MGAAHCSNSCYSKQDERRQEDVEDGIQSVASSIVEVHEILEFLQKVQLFKRLPEDDLPSLAPVCEVKEYLPGDVVIEQGDEGHELFVIRWGITSVQVNGQEVAQLKEGDYFGENALLRDEPRTATISAKAPLSTIILRRSKFDELGLREKLHFKTRKAIGGGFLETAAAKPPCNKTPAEREVMERALSNNSNLQGLVALDEAAINQLIDCAWQEDAKAGLNVISEGDINASFFYIVKSGKFDVLQTSSETGKEERVGHLKAGNSFGELALIYTAPRAATVRAVSDSELWVMDRSDFKKILADKNDKCKEYVAYLDKVQLLNQSLKPEEKEALAKSLTEMSFTEGELIFEQGEAGDSFYILVEGQVSVIKDGKEETRLTANTDTASHFGERALLNNEPRAATIKVTSTLAKTLRLDRETFEWLLGSLEELQKLGSNRPVAVMNPSASLLRKASMLRSASHLGTLGGDRETESIGPIERKDLKPVGMLGCGGFGSVELVEYQLTGETYALKAMSKGFIVQCGMKQSVLTEKAVQMMCNSLFIIRLYETYNSDQTLYFLLEAALGGELYATYNKKGFFGKENFARFYTAGVVMAFEHLHGKKILYRDLKPENLLLDEKGNVKLTDMGLAKVCIGKAFTACGTPDYFAPQLIASTGHNIAVDWWTLGIFAFELLSGHPPFESSYPMQTYQKIMRGINKVAFPPKCKGSAEDLIKSLCKSEPSERLPMKKGGTRNLKTHPFYKGFDWNAFETMRMPAPYQPSVTSKRDLSNFTQAKEMPPSIAYEDDHSNWDKDFATSS